MMIITSPQNSRIKDAARLREKKARTKTGLFAVEGAREIARALQSGYELVEVFCCEEFSTAEAGQVLKSLGSVQPEALVGVAPAVFAKLAVREGSDGLYAVMRQRHHRLDDLPERDDLLVLIVEGVEKPGNLGALLRSADGVGADGVIVLDDAIDPFNPNVVRASLGTLFSQRLVVASREETRAFCRDRGIQVVAAALQDAVDYADARLDRSTAILLGSEAHGLSDYWMTNADVRVRIPMNGIADSLNVSVAGAVLLYEALRQRRSRR